ncbi:MAG: hypothetical protein ACXVB5_18190 [Isosphaeraceae bacterium]
MDGAPGKVAGGVIRDALQIDRPGDIRFLYLDPPDLAQAIQMFKGTCYLPVIPPWRKRPSTSDPVQNP